MSSGWSLVDGVWWMNIWSMGSGGWMSDGCAPCRIELQETKVETLSWAKGKCPLEPKTYKALL